MGKKARAKSKERRLKEKRARKAANRARYEKWRDMGQNSKSKRARAGSKKRQLANVVSHPNGACGNVGCMRCSAVYQIGGPLHHLYLQHIENKKKQHKRDPLNTKPVEENNA
jgi:hypothetical protein